MGVLLVGAGLMTYYMGRELDETDLKEFRMVRLSGSLTLYASKLTINIEAGGGTAVTMGPYNAPVQRAIQCLYISISSPCRTHSWTYIG